MIPTYGYYPLGFRRQLGSGETKTDTDPDAGVVNLYLKWQQNRLLSKTWSNTSDTIVAALGLFGDARQWFRIQQYNEYLTPYGWYFLLQTIQFINTGKRDINMLTATNLILDDVEAKRRMPNSDRTVNLLDLIKTDSESLIGRWVRWPGGYDDLIQTLNVLFGNPRPNGVHVIGY